MLKIKHQKRDPFVPPISISALYDLSSFRHVNDVVANQKEIDFTRKELKNDRKVLAKAFLALGIKKGDIILIATGRSMYENILIFLAANKIGAIASFLDEKTPRDTLLHYLDEFNSPLAITYKYSDRRIKELKREAKNLKNVINMDGKTVDEGGPDDEQAEDVEISALDGFWLGKQNIRKVAENYHGHVPMNIFGANREALISFTSGSTSGPKPMVFTNKNIIADAIYSKVASNVKMWDKNLHTWMSYVKFDCPYGLVVSVIAPICGGGEVILTPDINDSNLDYYIGKNPNTIFGIPPLLEAMPNLKEDTDISNLKMFASGGERLEKSASLAALDFFKSRGLKNIKISNGYGVGEALGLISTAVGTAAYNPDSVGRIPAGTHVMVLDPETGEELNFGKTGILYATGKHILNRYYNRPELDDEKLITIHGRKFVKTGDLAYVSETGYITLVGRATFFINNLPAKVYYEVVRAAVSKSDLVKKCYVVKGPDEKLKLASYAFVVVNDEVGQNNEVRRAIVKKATEPFNLGKRRITLKSYEIPRKVIFLDDLPLTRANKTDFRKLEKMAREM
ncbi:acyl--CoA ligase [Candidatus Saccharibacteria bacterium]|nr:acyl--CoA ligase [Candidatus Saccharibacteria bacterium]